MKIKNILVLIGATGAFGIVSTIVASIKEKNYWDRALEVTKDTSSEDICKLLVEAVKKDAVIIESQTAKINLLSKKILNKKLLGGK